MLVTTLYFNVKNRPPTSQIDNQHLKGVTNINPPQNRSPTLMLQDFLTLTSKNIKTVPSS